MVFMITKTLFRMTGLSNSVSQKQIKRDSIYSTIHLWAAIVINYQCSIHVAITCHTCIFNEKGEICGTRMLASN